MIDLDLVGEDEFAGPAEEFGDLGFALGGEARRWELGIALSFFNEKACGFTGKDRG